jgi:hypothetical protein
MRLGNHGADYLATVRYNVEPGLEHKLSRLPEFETAEKVDFRSHFLRKRYEMNVSSL